MEYNLFAPASKLALLHFLNQKIRLTNLQSSLLFGLSTYASVYRILNDSKKPTNLRKYVAMLCGKKREIEKARINEMDEFKKEKLFPSESWYNFAFKSGTDVLIQQKKSLGIFFVIKLILRTIRQKQISINDCANEVRDFTRTLLFVWAMPAFFWGLVAFDKHRMTKTKVNMYIVLSASSALLLENKKRWNSLANFMFASIL